MNKERVIVSSRLIVPLPCCEGIDEKALRFRRSMSQSISSGRLVADIAVKAAYGVGTTDSTYVDTDGKKRDFTGDLKPGMGSNDFGYRWEEERRWEEGRELVLTPSHISRYGLGNEANIGWIEPIQNKPRNAQEAALRIASQPHISLTKYRVNPKTDDIIPESEEQIDPFSKFTGKTPEQIGRGRPQVIFGNEQEKLLPGRNLGSRVPGGSLISRAAAAFGVIRDERNKFRCPPGTPAANQFTDATGSNCFGFSPTRFARFAQRQAAKLTEDDFVGLKNNSESFFRFLYGATSTEDMERVAMWESRTGKKIKRPDWRKVTLPEDMRRFTNGAIRGQDDIDRQKANVSALYDGLRIDADSPDAHWQALSKLKEVYDKTGGSAGWDITFSNGSFEGGDSSLLNDKELVDVITSRLQRIPNWKTLSLKEQKQLIDADVRRYRVTEKAMVETLLDQFLQNPSSVKHIGKIEHNLFTNHEAGTSFYAEQKLVQKIAPDGTPMVDDDGKPILMRVQGPMRTKIDLNMNIIMENQESMLPMLKPNERLAIAASGASSEAAARLAVADFIVNSNYAARNMAGLLDGPYSFSSHIMLHEIAHGIQGQVFLKKVQNQIDELGFIDVPIYDKNGRLVGKKPVTDIKQLTGKDIMNIMSDVADSINIEAMNDAMERIKDVAPLAGSYPRESFKVGSQIWALEASAELHALRERGIIYGEDIDAALAWMDDTVAEIAADERAVAEELEARRLEEASVDMPDDSIIPDEVKPEEVEEAVAEATERLDKQTLRKLESKKTKLNEMTEEELFEESIKVSADIKEQEKELEELKKFDIDKIAPLPDESSGASSGAIDERRNQLTAQHEQMVNQAESRLEYLKRLNDAVRDTWAIKFGGANDNDMTKFDDGVARIQAGLDAEAEAERVLQLRKEYLEDVAEEVSKMDKKKITRLVADLELQLKAIDQKSKQAEYLREELRVVRKQYAENLQSAGDTRTSKQIIRELDKEVKDMISPPPKTLKKFKNKAETKNHATKERKRLRASKIQKDALAELGDISTSDVGQLLDPVFQTYTGRAINKRNARLKRLGLPVDTSSASEADIADQLKNILIPAMEAIDSSSIADPFEIETIIDFDEGQIVGKMDGKEVEIERFVSGELIVGKLKKTDIPKSGIKDKSTNRTSRRVVISVREGDRGIFPRAGDGDQKFVIPPGRLRVIGRDEDGTIRAEISYQKSTVEVADSVANSILSNEGDKIWREGNGRKLKAVSDNYVNNTRAAGGEISAPRTDDEKRIVEKSDIALDEVIDAGGNFGEALDSPPESGTLSSGANSMFGKPETRAQRTVGRKTNAQNNIKNIKSVLTNSSDSRDDVLERSSIDPQVSRLIMDMPEEKIIQRVEEAAYQLHLGFDKRVRVRARDIDLEELSLNGSLSSGLNDPMANAQFESRRLERVARFSAYDVKRRKKDQELWRKISKDVREELERREKAKARSDAREKADLAKITKRVLDEYYDFDNQRLKPNLSPRISKEDEKRLSSGLATTLIQVWDTWNAADPDNLQATKDILQLGALISAREAITIEDAIARIVDKIKEKVQAVKDGRSINSRGRLVGKNMVMLDIPDSISYVNGLDSGVLAQKFIDRRFGRGRPINARTMGFSSGRISGPEKTLTRGALNKTPTVIRDKNMLTVETWSEVDVYNIGGENVVFGMRADFVPDSDIEFKSVPLNPYALSGRSWETEEGRELAKKWVLAHAAENEKLLKTNTGYGYTPSSTYVDALLYAGSRGDEDAMEEFENLAVEGRGLVEAAKSRNSKIGPYDNWTPESRQREIESDRQAITSAGLDDASIDSIYVVHETTHSIPFDDDGNIAIKPTGDYDVLDENGKPIKYGRYTVHFALNGVVAPVDDQFHGRPTPKESQVIIAPLRAILDANPGSLENLREEDTFFSVQPGVPLRIPKGTFKVLNRKQGVGDTFAEIDDYLKEQGAPNPRKLHHSPETPGANRGFGKFIEQTAKSLGVDNGIHQGSVAYMLEKNTSPGSVRRTDVSLMTAENLARLSENGWTRIGFIEGDVLANKIGIKADPLGTSSGSGVLPSGRRIQMDTPRQGMSFASYSRDYYSSTGIPSSLPNSKMPINGYLVHKSHVKARRDAIRGGADGNLNANAIFEIGDKDIVGDGLTANGDIEIVLKPAVARRTAYGRGNGIETGHRPVLLNSRNREDIADALIHTHGPDSRKRDSISMLNLLSSTIDNDFSRVNANLDKDGRMLKAGKVSNPGDADRVPFEAQVLGGFSIDEIEQINFPFSRVKEMSENEKIDDVVNDKSVAERLRSAGFTEEEIEYFYSIGGSGAFNTESMQLLRNYRAAQRLKKTYSAKGFNNVKIAHPLGIDMDDPRSYAKGNTATKDIETILKASIMREIGEDANRLIRDMRKKQPPRKVSIRGGLL